jgi:flavin-dependent dehydrogenase
MAFSSFDVVVVGGGCAGLTAAVGLARAGFAVAVVEAAEIGVYGSLGSVLSAESLLERELLGGEGASELAWERRLIERGGFVTDGRRISGAIYRDADAFRHCYTVLRSRFNPRLGEIARRLGVEVRTDTTVESLLRDGRRIVGVATTGGPLFARMVFLAEGDAGHLVSREGLDRFIEPGEHPAFLYCLQQIVDLPPGEVEKRFRVGVEEGVAYDFLLRNPGKTRLNARGMLCTNRAGLTLSVVLPAENLRRGFSGEPRQLLDWFANLPALRPWLGDAVRGAWTAALLRGGGWRDVPYLVEDGLAVGGAAAGLGLDFPVENRLGPATATALLLCRAAVRIRGEGGGFDREALTRHYLEPLQQTRAWRDVEYLQRWPGYVRKTLVLFDSGADLLLESSAIWGRSRRWLPWKFLAWLDVLGRVSWGRWDELRDDLIQLGRTLRLREVTPRPALTRFLLDGALNAFRDLARQPRPHLPPGGRLRIYYHSASEEGRASAVPGVFRRWFERFRPVLASAAHSLSVNEDQPLSAKMTRTIALLVRQINLFDLVAVAALAFPVLVLSTALALWSYAFSRPRRDRSLQNGEYLPELGLLQTMPPASSAARPPLIHILWRSTQPYRQAESVLDLPHICPAGVFEIEAAPPQRVQVAVHAERCIACEACWRTNALVDWGRNASLPTPPLRAAVEDEGNELASLFDQLERQLHAFESALIEGPALVDRPHNDYLETLAHFAHQLTIRIREVVQEREEISADRRRLLDLVEALVLRCGERTHRTWEGRFAWAVADGRMLRQYHVAELRRLLALPSHLAASADASPQPAANAAASPTSAADKHLLAGSASRRYVLEALTCLKNVITEPIRVELLDAFLNEVRDNLSTRTAEGTAPSEESYRRLGIRLLPDGEATRKLLDIPGDWPTLEQRRVLRSERQEVLEAERRLLALASDWGAERRSADAEIHLGFGRQAAYILAGKVLLLHTFVRLENAVDAESALVLLRVWLDYTATRLDEYTILVRDRLRPPPRHGDRPLLEPDSGEPLRTRAEYLAAPDTYASGDFLLEPLDLSQPRLVPEMCKKDSSDIKNLFDAYPVPGQNRYLVETMLVEDVGRRMHLPPRRLDLESACVRLIGVDPRQAGSGLGERCLILQAFVQDVIPRCLESGVDKRAKHLERDVLELEALKADFRQRLLAAWQVFGDALARNADVQASCFALAEAAAWLKAADSTLGRLGWIAWRVQTDEHEETPAPQVLGRRMLAHCFAEIRDRLFRFDEDLAALRRGYYAPHVYAAALLSRRQRGEAT